MKVVILCGGYGTRIREVTEDLPKPMIPLGRYPILWHIMKHYAQAGHDEFVLCLGYKGDVIRNFFLNYHTLTRDVTVTLGEAPEIDFHDSPEEEGWKVTLADTGQDTLTGSRLGRIKRYIADNENFLMTYGDGVGDIDLGALIDFHKSHGRIMTVSGVRPPGRFGELMHDGDGIVTEFNEKPQAAEGLISGGFFVCRRELFDYLDAVRDDEMLEQEPMRRLAREGQMAVYTHNGFWQCMDTRRDYDLLCSLLESGDAPWVSWG